MVLTLILTDTWCNMGTTLLITFRTTVACDSGDAVLTRTLAAGLVTGFARSSYRMTVAC